MRGASTVGTSLGASAGRSPEGRYSKSRSSTGISASHIIAMSEHSDRKYGRRKAYVSEMPAKAGSVLGPSNTYSVTVTDTHSARPCVDRAFNWMSVDEVYDAFRKFSTASTCRATK